MKLFRRLKKIKAKYYNRGCKDTANEYIKKINDANRINRKQLNQVKASNKKQLKILKNLYQKEEKEYYKLNQTLRAKIEYWNKKKLQIREVNSTSIALAKEHEEIVFSLWQDLGKLKALWYKLGNVKDKINNNIFKVKNN